MPCRIVRDIKSRSNKVRWLATVNMVKIGIFIEVIAKITTD